MDEETVLQQEAETGAAVSDETPAPEEQKTDAEGAETPEGAEAEAKTEGEEPEEKPKKPKQDPRDKELAYHRRRAERAERDLRDQNRRLAEENAALKSRAQPSSEPKTAGPPNQADFDDYGKYIEALTDWKVEQRMAQQQEQSNRQQRQTRAEANQTALAERWQELSTKGAETYDDFEDVAYDFPQTETMVVAIVNSEIGERIAYHLGSHPNEAAKIAKLDPVSQAKAIGRLETKLSAPPEKRTTKAKEPPSKVTGGAGGETPITPYTAQNYDQYRTARMKQEEARRR